MNDDQLDHLKVWRTSRTTTAAADEVRAKLGAPRFWQLYDADGKAIYSATCWRATAEEAVADFARYGAKSAIEVPADQIPRRGSRFD